MTLDPPKILPQPQELKAASKTTKKSKKKGKKRPFSEHLLRLALRTTGWVSKPLSLKLKGMPKDILRSNLYISPEGLISISVFLSLVLIPPTIIGIFALYRMGFVLESLGLAPVPILPLVIGISLPKISSSSRASALENELPYLIGYITVLAGGGISPLITLKRISRADNIFPAAAKEARRILLDIEVFGLDAISALERASRYTPNRLFSDFIGGYVAVLKTGGDAVSYLESKLREVFNYRESKVRTSSEFIGTMAEAYIISTVVMGISFMILFATSNFMTAGVTSVDPSMIIMFSGLFVPVISMIFITVIGSAQIKEPFGYDLPYYVFLGCTPIAAIFFFAPLPLALYTKLGIGLILTSSPAMIINWIYVKRKKEVEAKLSNFLRDISEVRKTGLAPEKTIEQLADRDYGGLSKHVKQISSELSWGTPMRTVLSNFSSAVKSWLSRAMAFLLLEVVDVGGGSPRMFVSLADFTEKNAQLEKERKSMIRPYIIIPYIGAILVVVTTAMMIYFVSAPSLNIPDMQGQNLGLPSQSIINQATTILLTASFFQAWIMGLVAGKMGEATVADGFKHATALVVISLITVYVSSFVIKFGS